MTPEQQKIFQSLTPEQKARLLEVLKSKGKQPKEQKPVEYKPNYGELRMAWRAKNGIGKK